MTVLVSFFLLIVGFVILIKGADWFVDGAAGIAEKFGISQIVIRIHFFLNFSSNIFSQK